MTIRKLKNIPAQQIDTVFKNKLNVWELNWKEKSNNHQRIDSWQKSSWKMD